MSAASRRARLADARIYLCTPVRSDLETFLDVVLGAGVDIVQLRDKVAPPAVRQAAAPMVRAAANRHGALFVVNDDPDLAVIVGADGVHVGQDDVSPAAARRVVGPDLLIGRSTHSTAEVDAAQSEDCDYFAVGPVSATPTKQGRPGVGLIPVRHAAAVATKPWFVTGGMAPDTAPAVLAAGGRGIVVVRALTEASDPADVARSLRRVVDTHPVG